MINNVVCPDHSGTSEKRWDKQNLEIGILSRGQTHFRVCPGNNIPKRDNELLRGFDTTAQLQKPPIFPVETIHINRDKLRDKRRNNTCTKITK